MGSYKLFILASMALIVTPGPDMLYVLTRGIADGRCSGAMSALGVTAGILIHTMAAALGLAVLLRTSSTAFWTLKLIGGIYLIYVGYQMLKQHQAFEMTPNPERIDIKKCFLRGFVSNVVNPKVALFFVAFLPQFVSPDSPHPSLEMMALGGIFALMAILFLVALGYFAGGIGLWLHRRKKMSARIRLGSGMVIMLLGLRLLLSQRE